MKKYIFIIAAAILAMTSCSDSDVIKKEVANENIPFSFSAYSSKSTKANDNHTALNFFYTKFNVYGWKKVNGEWKIDIPVFDNVTNEYFTEDGKGSIYPADGDLTVSGEWNTIQSPAFPKWYYKDIRFWDKFATNYQFSAYVPVTASDDVVCTYDGVITIGATNNITVDTKNLMANPAKDLAYKGFDYDYMTATSTEKTSAVSLVFTHELAKFNIKLVLDNSVTTNQPVVVNEVSLLNLNGTSSYASDKENATGYLTGWTTPTDEIEYKVIGVGAATDGYQLNLDIDASTEGNQNYDGYYVMERLMIPQTAEKAVDAQNNAIDCQITEFDEPCVFVKYTIGSEPYVGYYALANLFIGTGSGDHYDFLGGNEYTLTINVGPSPIYFTTSVTTWAEDAANDADLEAN